MLGDRFRGKPLSLKEGLGPVPEVTVPLVEELPVDGEVATEDGVTSY
jgi:hypothetical protein